MYLQFLKDVIPTAASVGGKAANTAIMQHNGFNVPESLVLKHELLTEMVPDLLKLIDNIDSTYNINEACNRVKDLISRVELPDSIFMGSAEVDSLNELLKTGVVVRSSGTLEDSSTASFAGCYETFFGATSIHDLKEFIKKCWISSVSPEVFQYKQKKNIEGFVPVSILIQKQVQCEKAGVCFSQPPLQHVEDQVLIEANWGSCLSVVSGTVSPDRFYVNTRTKHIDKCLGQKHSYSLLSDSGAVNLDAPEDLQSLYCLSDEEAYTISTQVLNLSAIFNSEVDVEWGYIDKELVLFQCRPITTISNHN